MRKCLHLKVLRIGSAKKIGISPARNEGPIFKVRTLRRRLIGRPADFAHYNKDIIITLHVLDGSVFKYVLSCLFFRFEKTSGHFSVKVISIRTEPDGGFLMLV